VKNIKRVTIASAISASLLVAGCGGSSSGSSSDSGSSGGSGSSSGSTSISGIASAPAGVVASYEEAGIFQLAVNFLVPPLAAAITGLEPIEGATVELIRVDDDGEQVGDVLATAATSITGDYTLPLPEDVNLAGNLVVRISGQNNTSLRAQVVEKEVDITPVSEFVLRKFIDQGADLDQLVVSDVVKLSGRVEEFDLTLSDSADLEQAFAALEEEIGDYVENQVTVASASHGDASTVTGNYRSAALSLSLHDSDNNTYGTYATDLWLATFKFTDDGDNNLSVTHTGEDSFYANLSGSALNQSSVEYESDIEQGGDTFTATLTDNGILSIAAPFEEDIDDDYGWRYPAITYNLQQVGNSGLFFQVSNEAAVRYSTIDTNDDGEADAIDPDQKQGDEVFRTLEVFSRQPTDFKDADLDGDFGRVFIETWVTGGTIELQTETNIVTFAGDGTFDYGAVTGHLIGMEAQAQKLKAKAATKADPETALTEEDVDNGTTYTAITESADTDQPIVITSDGDITAAGYDDDGVTLVPADGFINDNADVLVFAEAEGEDQDEAQTNMTLLVKLPATQPEVTGNTYRMLLVAQALLDDEEILLTSSRFNTFVTMESETAGTVEGSIFEVEKTGLGDEVDVETEEVSESLTASIGSNGKSTLTIANDDGTSTMTGFFNEGASLGLFTYSYAETGANPDELGLVVLVKVTD